MPKFFRWSNASRVAASSHSCLDRVEKCACCPVTGAQRDDDGFIDDLAKRGIAYVPFFPLGGVTPLQSSELDHQTVKDTLNVLLKYEADIETTLPQVTTFVARAGRQGVFG